MIIEAGYDLATLLFDLDTDPTALRVVALDGDFRVISLTTASGEFHGDLSAVPLSAIDSVIPEHDEDDEFAARYAVRFVALGFRVERMPDELEGPDGAETKIRDWLACRGIDLLGTYVTDGTMWRSSGPMKTFSTYVGAEDYPRVVSVRAPHPFLTCECVVCGPEREALERARAARVESDIDV
jgi:hypothetical protein